MLRRRAALIFACTTIVGCAKTPPKAEPDPPPQEVGKPLEKEPALDRTQETVYNVVNFLIEERKDNLGFGIEFEMQFGVWPGRPQT